MITPTQNYNYKSSPAFQRSIPDKLMNREVSMVLSSLSKETKEKVVNIIGKEAFKSSITGRLIAFFAKIILNNIQKNPNGICGVAFGAKEDFINQLAEIHVMGMLTKYLAKLFPDDKGNIGLHFEGKTKGYTIHKFGDVCNFELDRNYRKAFVGMIEEAQSFKDLKSKIDNTKPVL